MRLIFVYNADSGAINSILDGVHKIVSPETYNCKLCAITFGNFSEKQVWKEFRDTSGIEMEFYHRDEFQKQFRSKWLPKYDFPIILSAEKENLDIFMTLEELNEIEDVSELIKVIREKVKAYANSNPRSNLNQ